MKTIYALFWGLFFTTASWAQCLEQLNSPASTDWSSAYFHSSGQGWITGGQGRIYQTVNGGQTWAQLDPRSAVNFRAVAFLGQTTGWLVGDEGVIRRTTNGGASWQQQFSPLGADLNDVAFVFSNLGLAAGDCGALLRTVNGGAAWSWVDPGTTNNLHTLHWVNTQVALAAGEGGTVLRSTNGGQTWNSVGGTGNGDHFALEAQGSAVWLSGAGGTYFSDDAGASWAPVSSYQFNTLASDGAGTVVGAGADGLVAVSHDGGQHWVELGFSLSTDWSQVVLTGTQTGYLVGSESAVAAFRWVNASASGPGLVCAGEVVELAGSAAPGLPDYSWSGPGGFTANEQIVSFVPVESGWYTLQVEENGCTAKDSVFLQVSPVPGVDLGGDIVLCEGESVMLSGPSGNYDYNWSVGSNTPALNIVAAGLYGLTVTTQDGCTASDMVAVEVQENGTLIIDTLLCSGDFLEVNGTFYDEFNPVGTQVLPGAAANGCDSLIMVQLQYSIAEPITLDTLVCETAFPFVYEGLVVDSPGDYFTQGTNAEGCPQMIFLSVQELQSYQVTVEDSFCAGGFYVWNAQVLTAAGTYTETFTATDGCDSTVTLELTVFTASETELEFNICEGEVVEVGSQVFGAAGAYEIELTNTAGCDSIVYLDLSVALNDTISELETICQGDTYLWEGMVLDSPGPYQVVLANEAGCDSIRQLQLVVAPNPELFIVDTLPDNGTGNGAAVLDVLQGQAPFSVNWSNGGIGLVQTGLEAGTYTVNITDANDCSDTLLVTVPMATSLSKLIAEEVAVWPNPTTGQLRLQFPHGWKAADVNLVLYDLPGRRLQSWNGQRIGENLELAVPAGTYWLRIEYRGYRQVQQVVVAD